MSQLILADKSDLFRRSMASVLNREGFEVLLADAGQKVLAMLKESRPTAIILDTEVENPSGLETLRQLKLDPKLRRLPVVVVSRDSAAAAVSIAYKVGADGYLVKPVELNDLIKMLQKFRMPVPALNAPVILAAGDGKLVGKLRFLDEYGGLYLDKEAPEPIAPVGTQGIISFPAEKDACYQLVRITEENEQGIGLYPVGNPTKQETPEAAQVTTSLKARYLLPGSFMRLASITQVSSEGFKLAGVNSEPRFNSAITVTIYPPTTGLEGGLTIEGQVCGFHSQSGGTGLVDVDVALSGPVGLPYIQLLSELISGRPMPATAPQEAP